MVCPPHLECPHPGGMLRKRRDDGSRPVPGGQRLAVPTAEEARSPPASERAAVSSRKGA